MACHHWIHFPSFVFYQLSELELVLVTRPCHDLHKLMQIQKYELQVPNLSLSKILRRGDTWISSIQRNSKYDSFIQREQRPNPKIIWELEAADKTWKAGIATALMDVKEKMLLLNKQPKKSQKLWKRSKNPRAGRENYTSKKYSTWSEKKKTVGWRYSWLGKYRTLYSISLICITKIMGPHYHVFAVFANKPRGFKTLTYVSILSNWAWQSLWRSFKLGPTDTCVL